ncbi:hypothetical protein A8B75_07360 [Sphingomonadales bacterium EhC05]|nr:hypothetical protein A8B75_07360 [Sphingomonadales bacterium EhC05]
MADLEITRHFAASPKIVFAFVTRPEHLAQWWGPEGIHLGEHDLDFTRLGPWGSVMHGDEGATYKVTGQVLAIEEGQSVSFTWAWHDEADVRGDESRVTFSVYADGKGGTDFVMLHSGLPDDDSANNHEDGWTSSLVKLIAYAEKNAG